MLAQTLGSAWGDLDVEGQRVDAAGLIFEQLEWLEDRIHYLRRTLATVLMEPTADSFKGHGLDSGVDYAGANPWRGHDDGLLCLRMARMLQEHTRASHQPPRQITNA